MTNDSIRNAVFDFAAEKYSVRPEYLWEKTPDAAVLRHNSNNKWFAVIMNVRKDRLGLMGSESIDVIVLKCDPNLIGSLILKEGYEKAYHMNKEKWITVFLDGSVKQEEVFSMLDLSFELTLG